MPDAQGAAAASQPPAPEAGAALVIAGIGVGQGVVMGRAEVLASSRAAVEHYFIEPDAVEAEVTRVLRARDAVIQEV